MANSSEVEFLKEFEVEIDLADYMTRFVGKNNKDVLAELERDFDVMLLGDFW